MKNRNTIQTKLFRNFFLILLFASTGCAAQPRLLALSKSDHTLAIIDPASNRVLARVPVGNDPHEVIAAADGKTAYVSSYGGGSFHELDIIDLISMKPLKTIDTRPLFGPHGLVFTDGKVWFTAEGSKAVGCYNPSSGKVEWSMGTGQDRTHMIYVDKNANNIYATNVSSGTVSILEKTTSRQRENWEQTVIPLSNGVEGFGVSPEGKELWAVASDNGKIYIINPGTKKVVETIDAKIGGANRLQFTPDGKRVLITSLQAGSVFIYDTKSRKETAQVKVGTGAAGIMVSPDGSKAYIACSPDNYIAVVDLKALKVIDHVDVGKNPDGLAWADINP
ncbi:MAG: YncE family protein [Ginsengibacter sp.]